MNNYVTLLADSQRLFWRDLELLLQKKTQNEVDEVLEILAVILPSPGRDRPPQSGFMQYCRVHWSNINVSIIVDKIFLLNVLDNQRTRRIPLPALSLTSLSAPM
jgi:hypothetical protein